MPQIQRIANALLACLVCAISLGIGGTTLWLFISGGYIDAGDLSPRIVFWLSEAYLFAMGSPLYLGFAVYVYIRKIKMWPAIVLAAILGMTGAFSIFLMFSLFQGS